MQWQSAFVEAVREWDRLDWLENLSQSNDVEEAVTIHATPATAHLRYYFYEVPWCMPTGI